MAIVLLWIALAALAIAALDWLFPAWHNASGDARNKQDATKDLDRL